MFCYKALFCLTRDFLDEFWGHDYCAYCGIYQSFNTGFITLESLENFLRVFFPLLNLINLCKLEMFKNYHYVFLLENSFYSMINATSIFELASTRQIQKSKNESFIFNG